MFPIWSSEFTEIVSTRPNLYNCTSIMTGGIVEAIQPLVMKGRTDCDPFMRYSISDTAEYGDYVTGKRIVTEETRKEMKKVLTEIQDGTFARNWILENRVGRPHFNAMKRQGAETQLVKVGQQLRSQMTFLKK